MSAPAYWPRARRSLAGRDPVMAFLIRAHPRIALAGRGDPFQTLARAIVGQQISVQAAASVWAKLAACASAIAPEAILGLPEPALRACGLSGRKAEYIRGLALHFANGSLRVARWAEMADEEVVGELVAVRGIGRWTAEMFLMFCLMRPDVLPVDDLGLRKAAGVFYGGGEPLGPDALHHLARAWTPWRSAATWYLWRALDPVPVEY